MKIDQLRKALKIKWLNYYQQNRQWLVRLGIWVNYDGQRRPSSSFILATLAILEPQLTQLLPLIVDLNNNPDQIVAALGLNFNPDTELKAVPELEESIEEVSKESVKMLPSTPEEVKLSPPTKASNLPSFIDESCRGVKGERD